MSEEEKVNARTSLSVRDFLLPALQSAVFVLVQNLNELDESSQQCMIQRWLEIGTEQLTEHGDMLLFGPIERSKGKKEYDGETAKSFDGLAKGTAALSTMPGGVPFLGKVWCWKHSPGGRNGEYPCVDCVEEERSKDA
jgi:hypothetical protein